MSTNQAIKIPQLCIVDYGSHIGEYIRQKLDERGIKHGWVADQIRKSDKKMSRSAFSKLLSSKAELYPSEMEMIAKHLPEDFFDEFYTRNKMVKPYIAEAAPSPAVSESKDDVVIGGSGYKLTLEIDPENFKPELLDPINKTLRKALEDFHEKIKQDEKRTK